MAAITATTKTSGGLGSGSSGSTASITPSANKLVLVAVANYLNAGGSTNIPTVTGCGMTWEQIGTGTGQSGTWRITLFRGMSASPSTGALTIDFGGQNQTAGFDWAIQEFGNVDTTGTNGSGAIVQSAVGTGGGSGTGITMTLGAFGNTSNATFGCANAQASINAGSGFTRLYSQGSGNAGGANLGTEWRTDNSTSVPLTWASAPYGNGIAVELKFQAPITTGGAFLLNFV